MCVDSAEITYLKAMQNAREPNCIIFHYIFNYELTLCVISCRATCLVSVGTWGVERRR